VGPRLDEVALPRRGFLLVPTKRVTATMKDPGMLLFVVLVILAIYGLYEMYLAAFA
jgi:hypothetical protein